VASPFGARDLTSSEEEQSMSWLLVYGEGGASTRERIYSGKQREIETIGGIKVANELSCRRLQTRNPSGIPLNCFTYLAIEHKVLKQSAEIETIGGHFRR